MIEIASNYLGGMIGSALGDAIGELAFYCPSKKKLSNMLDQLETYRYTDDTVMSIGIAQSVLEKGCLVPQELGEIFRRNFRHEAWRGYAFGPPTVFSMAENLDITYTEAAQTFFGGSGSWGNGAAMRVVPVGLFFHDSPHLYEIVSLSAAVIHAHPVGMDGAAVQAKAVAFATEIESADPFPCDEFIETLLGFAKTSEMTEKIQDVRNLLAGRADPSVTARQLGHTVAVNQSLPYALYAFLYNPKSFEDCLFSAILHGGDRDTLGAMACAISGSYLGVEHIPKSWQAKLENRALIEHLALKLSRTKAAS